MLTRRQLLKTGVFGGVLLAGAAYFATPARDAAPALISPMKFLSAHDALLIGVIAPAMLAVQPLPLDEVVRGVDAAIMALPHAVQAEVRQLLDLLANPWGRRVLAGVSVAWNQASTDEVSAFLHRWQGSRLVLLRSGFQALHALIMAAWYGNPHSWAAIGYQQPQQFKELWS